MTMASYFIDNDSAGEKLATTLSVILSIVLYHNRIEDKAPPVSYATVSDYFKIWCVEIPMVLMLGQNVLAIWGHNYADPPQESLDSQLFYAWCAFFAAVIIGFFCYTIYLWRKKTSGAKGYDYLAGGLLATGGSEFSGESEKEVCASEVPGQLVINEYSMAID
jgi:hypothetical protein